ncbi:MAG: ABC transporter ATP-binding protein [Proteobacteria bacterium]|nr:ABC transporter ATP-binding protein [Pseudomonadota bacterium]
MAYLKLRNVDVDFPVYGVRGRRLLTSNLLRLPTGGVMAVGSKDRVTVSALRDITIDIEHGERLGLIGHNGAGKTTLLRVLAGIYHPTRGSIRHEGRVSPMFTITLGMEPDATGYENIRVSGLLRGMTRSEIEAAIPEIEEFTELGDYLALPVRTYSTGMFMRLAFGIATAKVPEILLLDEGLAAGDAAFAAKAKDRLHKFFSESSILVIASHSAEIIRDLCNRAALLEKGQIVFYGDVDEALECYSERAKTPPS